MRRGSRLLVLSAGDRVCRLTLGWPTRRVMRTSVTDDARNQVTAASDPRSTARSVATTDAVDRGSDDRLRVHLHTPALHERVDDRRGHAVRDPGVPHPRRLDDTGQALLLGGDHDNGANLRITAWGDPELPVLGALWGPGRLLWDRLPPRAGRADGTYGTRNIQAGKVASPFGFQDAYTDPTGLLDRIRSTAVSWVGRSQRSALPSRCTESAHGRLVQADDGAYLGVTSPSPIVTAHERALARSAFRSSSRRRRARPLGRAARCSPHLHRRWRRHSVPREAGLDMSRFPTPGHLASWAEVAPPRCSRVRRVTAERPAGTTATWTTSSGSPPLQLR